MTSPEISQLRAASHKNEQAQKVLARRIFHRSHTGQAVFQTASPKNNTTAALDRKEVPHSLPTDSEPLPPTSFRAICRCVGVPFGRPSVFEMARMESNQRMASCLASAAATELLMGHKRSRWQAIADSLAATGRRCPVITGLAQQSLPGIAPSLQEVLGRRTYRTITCRPEAHFCSDFQVPHTIATS